MTVRALTAPNPGPFTLDGTKTYLLGEDAVLDPGPDDEAHIGKILDLVPGLKTILVTHRHGDHAPAALALKERCGASIWAPAGAFDDGAIDKVLEDGETIEVGDMSLEVIATPGHTAEHVCFLSDTGELFTGDTVLGQGTTAIFAPDGNMRDYVESLKKLFARKPTRIYPGHGPVRHDAEALLDEYIYHRLSREEQVIEQLATGPKTTAQLREAIYPGLEASLHSAAEAQMTAHLAWLKEKGQAAESNGAWSAS